MESYCKSIILDWIETKPGYFVEQCKNQYCKRTVCLYRKQNIKPYNMSHYKTICPNCGAEYNASQHWLVCPNCGHETPKHCEHFDKHVTVADCNECAYIIKPEFRLGERRCAFETI